MRVHNFKELKVWQKSMELTKISYLLTASFPNEEKFALAAQIQRSAVSIPSKIAEGCGRVTDKDLQHFLTYAMGSSYELETQVILAKELAYISDVELQGFEKIVSEVQRMLFGFYNSLNK